jgi:hypothetical protein
MIAFTIAALSCIFALRAAAVAVELSGAFAAALVAPGADQPLGLALAAL